MASQVWNVTQKRWIYQPGEVYPGDTIQRDKDDSTPMHWVNEAFNRDGSRRYSGHWAKISSIENKLNGTGKGGTMTDIHREGEMEIYCKFFDCPIFLIPPVVIPCPAASICKDHCTNRCKVSSNGIFNVRDYFAGHAIYDPHRNLDNDFSCDIVIPNLTTKEEFGFEIHNTNAVDAPKWLSGMPMMEFDCQNGKDLKVIKSIRTIDLTDPKIMSICHVYNLGMLPWYRDCFPCSKEKILSLMANEATKHSSRTNQRYHSKSNIPAPFSGYEPWDIWQWDYPRGRKGQLIEKVLRDDTGGVEWTRHHTNHYGPVILLSRRTRNRFNLQPTRAEQEMDANYLTYLRETYDKK